MKYQIRYTGTTGDSFSTHEMDNILELEWDNLDVATANLKRIQEHYEQYTEIRDGRYSRRKRIAQEVITSNKDKDWIVLETKIAAFKDGQFERIIDKKQISLYEGRGYEIKDVYDETYAQNCIKLYADNGNVFQMSCPWCGYFETLYSVEIENVINDLKIEF